MAAAKGVKRHVWINKKYHGLFDVPPDVIPDAYLRRKFKITAPTTMQVGDPQSKRPRWKAFPGLEEPTE